MISLQDILQGNYRPGQKQACPRKLTWSCVKLLDERHNAPPTVRQISQLSIDLSLVIAFDAKGIACTAMLPLPEGKKKDCVHGCKCFVPPHSLPKNQVPLRLRCRLKSHLRLNCGLRYIVPCMSCMNQVATMQCNGPNHARRHGRG